jgi:hypothetical protein
MTHLYTSVEIAGGSLGNQLFQLAYMIYFLRLSKTQRIKRKLVFNGDNPYWNTLFKGLFRVITDDIYNSIPFTKYHEAAEAAEAAEAVEAVEAVEEPPYMSKEHVLLKGKYQTFKYIDDSLRDKMVNIVYSNEDIMYPAYYKYREILDYFGKDTKDDEMVSLHIRRKTDATRPLLMRYYKEALRLANKKNIVVFSDDIAWCINNLRDCLNSDSSSGGVGVDGCGYNIYYVKDVSNPEVEFITMSMFQHNIIADSDFSLWASFISYYTTKTVIAPKHEYSNELYHKYITHII